MFVSSSQEQRCGSCHRGTPQCYPSGARRDFFPSKAKSRRSTTRNVLPGGFESLVGIEEGPNPSRLAVLELHQVGPGRLDLDTALRATPTHPTVREHSIAEVTDLRDLEVELSEGGKQILQAWRA